MKRPTREVAYSVFLLRKKATLVAFVHARDADDAIRAAVRDYQIRPADRFRLAARPGW